MEKELNESRSHPYLWPYQMNIVKTTIEIDEDKLERVMRLGNFKTRKDAMDWALTEAERLATLNHIAENPWSADILKDAVDEDYDPIALRGEPVKYSEVFRKERRRKSGDK